MFGAPLRSELKAILRPSGEYAGSNSLRLEPMSSAAPGSKQGPAELSDGDELRLGQTPLVFRIHRASAPTATER